MTQSLACLAVLIAVLAALLRWDLPAGRAAPVVNQARVDRTIQKGISFLQGARAKPRVRIKVVVNRIVGDPDNSNCSYAALGLRTCSGLIEPPSWARRTVWTLERANRAATSTLKELARKSILGRVS
jgi:hypothetical protein